MKKFRHDLCRRAIALFSAFVLVFFSIFPSLHSSALPSLSAKSAILMDFDSGEVLYEHNARQKMGMASTTKIMTALTVLSLLEPSDMLTVPKQAVGTEGSSVYLNEGEKLTALELLYALLLSSANDAAVALAVCAAGSIERFADKMNSLAADLGALDTHFVNPHGLYDKEHYTTAYDLALISRAALEDPTLRTIFATYKKTIPFCGKKDGRLVVNHNKMLRTYEGANGIKTGFTKMTGRCLVSSATRDGLTLIAVTLCAPDDWRDHTAMLDYGFESFCRVKFADVGQYRVTMPICGSIATQVTLTNTKPLALTLPKKHAEEKYTVLSSYRFIYAPVKENYTYATVTVSVGNSSVTSPLQLS